MECRCEQKSQFYIIYSYIYMHILLYAAIASYLTTAHHCIPLLDHLFNSLYYAILTSYHHFTYSVFYSICSYFNITPSFHTTIQLSIQYAAILTSLHNFTYCSISHYAIQHSLHHFTCSIFTFLLCILTLHFISSHIQFSLHCAILTIQFHISILFCIHSAIAS